MILTKKIKILNNSFYKNKGYLSDSDNYIEINIDDLSKGSSYLVNAKCDFCGVEKEISYKLYNINLKKTNMFSCGSKCSIHKTKKTNLEKYGVEHALQNKEIKEKVKATNLERYGVEHALQNKDLLDKLKKTNLEKYGVEFVQQNKEIKEKVKATNLERYGTECSLHSIIIKQKVKESNLKKYGYESHLKSNIIKEKIKLSNLDNFGVENVFQNNLIKEKIKLTNLEKFGYVHFKKSQSSKVSTIIANNPNYVKYIDDKISLFNCDLDKDHQFEIHIDNFHGRLKNNTPLCTVCFPIGKQTSIKEQFLLEYVKKIYIGEIISGYRDGLEIDIYLPELNIGIEFNGLYWHSNKFKENNYHISKLNFFKEKGINIKFIWEDDFDNNFDIIKSQIKNWLGKTENKIYARKTTVKQITNVDEYRNFLNNNHIQGYINSILVYGLYHDNILVSLMSFDKKEGRKNMKESGWNLNRFCNLLNTNVIGGASKLLNHFIKENNPKRIISYADKDWSNGHLYFTLGFLLINESNSDYKYIVDGVRKSKQNFTKSKLEKMGHDISLTESKIMENLEINKIYDCGKMKFELIF